MTEPNDLWEDMATLNSLYGELCWDHDEVLEFIPDFENDRIIIKRKSTSLINFHHHIIREVRFKFGILSQIKNLIFLQAM